jgi:L-threonylcarbamoyladenylate synthase
VQILKLDQVLNDDSLIQRIVTTLREGGVVCFPDGGTYRLLADLLSESAVNKMLQSKRRTANHPALVLVPSLLAAKSVVKGTQWHITKRLAEKCWPAALTLLLEPSAELPAKIKRQLTKATGKLGVRMPADKLSAAVMAKFAGPLLMSSANLEDKAGANSAAAIRQRFVGKIDLWVDGGDTTSGSPSTLVDVSESSWVIVRRGAVPDSTIAKAMQSVALP